MDVTVEPKAEYHYDVHGNRFDAMPVVVTNIDISFMQAVALMVKLSIAAIPAGIIIFLIYGVIGAILSGAGVSLFHPFSRY